MTREAEDILSYRLAHPGGGPLPPWTPGAHIDLDLPIGMARQYSLCGNPDDRSEYRIAVLRESAGRGGSDYLHEKIGPGSDLDVRAVRNNFPLVEAPRYVFVAGGIGITPLLPMVRAAHARETDWHLYYGARTRARMAFTGELEEFGERVHRYPQDERGMIPLGAVLDTAPETRVYCCGPGPLLDAVENLCPPDILRTERFQPRADSGPTVSDRPFTVVLEQSGRTVEVGAGESILAAMEKAGADVPSSCREGTCATCETAVLDGAVDHRDSILTPAERESGRTMMICVSRARGDRLILDA